MDSFKVPRGTYYLGDPCYCFDKKWQAVLDASKYFEEPYKEGRRVAVAFNTKYGDGVYLDQHGTRYGVDAGLIGLVPVGMAEKDPGEASQRVTFSATTECTSDDGLLTFGTYAIQTGEEDSEEEEDFSEDEDEEFEEEEEI